MDRYPHTYLFIYSNLNESNTCKPPLPNQSFSLSEFPPLLDYRSYLFHSIAIVSYKLKDVYNLKQGGVDGVRSASVTHPHSQPILTVSGGSIY